MNFDRAFLDLMRHEGRYTNNSDDPGGKTNWGITEVLARKNGYVGDMRDLPRNKARQIYRDQYWGLFLDDLPYIVAFNIFDASVNHGKRTAIELLQKVVGVKIDGFFGEKTFAATEALNAYKVTLLFNSERLRLYAHLRTFRVFGRGWVRRVANNLTIGM